MKAKLLLTTLGACLFGLATTAMADPATYRDGKLVIPSAAAISATKQQYYADVVLVTDAAGKLQIESATPLPLVYVDSVIPAVTENDDLRSAKLTIAGNKSVPCVKLQDAAVSYKDGVFTVLLAESVMGPAESCIAVLDPFQVTVELDVSKLQAGTYKAVVNAKEVSFVLTKNP
jgi:hypothetical protein